MSDPERYTDDAGASHTAGQCRWQRSRIYPDSDACLVNGAAHYRPASPSGPSPAAGLDPDLVEQAFKNLGLWGDYPEWTKTRREYAEKFAAEYARLSRSGGEAR